LFDGSLAGGVGNGCKGRLLPPWGCRSMAVPAVNEVPASGVLAATVAAARASSAIGFWAADGEWLLSCVAVLIASLVDGNTITIPSILEGGSSRSRPSCGSGRGGGGAVAATVPVV